MKSLPKLIRSFWLVALLALFGLCSAASTPGMTVPAIAYDEGALPTIAYDVPSLSVFDYDVAPALPANERERRGAETSGVFAGFSSFLAAKTAPKLLNPGINVTEKGMQHVLERHIVNGIPEFAGKSKFTTGVNLTELIQQGTQMPMVRQANGNFARTFDAGRIIGIDRTTGHASSTVTIITRQNGDLVTMFPGAP